MSEELQKLKTSFMKIKGFSFRTQIFFLIMVFIVASSAVSFYTNQQFILRDKQSSLVELQTVRVTQVKSQVEANIDSLKGLILESAVRLLDKTRAKPDLNSDDWQYLVAGSEAWLSIGIDRSSAPASAVAGKELLIELSEDKEWVLWSQGIEVASGNEQKEIPVQAKFRSNLLFKSLSALKEGALNVVLVRRNSPKNYELLWGNPEAIHNLNVIDEIDDTVLGFSSGKGSNELTFSGEKFFVSKEIIENTPWVVYSSVKQSTLISGLKFLVAEQSFWILTIVLFAGIMTIWFARRFSKPIETLVAASKELETGDFSVRVQPEGPTELLSLGSAFNHMGEALDQREKALKAAQDALIQNEKLAALGTLSAGIAHEVKNPLAGILGNADLLASALKKAAVTGKALQHVETIRKETKRCREIIDSLMRFSRQESTTSEKKEVDLELVVWDSINLVEHSLNMQGFKIEKKFPDDLPVVLGVANQIEQVLLNMLQNAGHAMEASGGKVITVGIESFDSIANAKPGAFVPLEPNKISGQVVRIWIKDEGTGMSPEIQRRIFEPFFTTKEAGKGTGLGLAVTMGILADHEVRLSIDSAVGQGTTFYIDFGAVGPRSEEFKDKVAKMRQRASGGEQGEFDVGSASHSEPAFVATEEKTNIVMAPPDRDDGIDLGVLGDDKPIALFDEPPVSTPKQPPRPPTRPMAKPPVAAKPSNENSVVKEKTSTGFAVRKPKMKG